MTAEILSSGGNLVLQVVAPPGSEVFWGSFNAASTVALSNPPGDGRDLFGEQLSAADEITRGGTKH